MTREELLAAFATLVASSQASFLTAFADLLTSSGATFSASPPTETLTWAQLSLPGDRPSTVSTIRGSVVRGADTYVSAGGSAYPDAQLWKRIGNGFVKHSHFNRYRMNCLLVDPANNDIYLGLGTQGVPGEAYVGKYDAAENYSQIGSSLPGADIVYSMCWHEGQVHAGLMSENNAGAARVIKWTGSTWANVFVQGLNGAPSSYTYAGAYITFVFNGMLHAGFFSRTAGHAHVWRKTAGGWVNLGCPIASAEYALANIEYDGKLVVAFSGDGSNGPIRSYNEATQTWEVLGNIPAAWSGADIFNHLCLDSQGRLYVGVGGAAGKLSVWRLNGATWEKVAGNGLNGSFASPLGTGGAREWVYRLQPTPAGTILACVSSEFPNGSVSVWELTIS
jgi:hypothetical protein